MMWTTHIAVLLQIFVTISGQDGMFDKNTFSGIGETPLYWRTEAKRELQKARNLKFITEKAYNVILFLGDGMGVSTLTPSRILKGQLKNKSGEEELLSWDMFPHAAFAKTYNQDHQTPDSAGTATAYLSGVKTNLGMVGVDARTTRGNCASAQGANLDTIYHWSLEKGKRAGLVTTARVTHATPAALYAHSADRNWEADSNMPTDAAQCKDIAAQLIDDNPDMHVIMGGGREYFLPKNVNDYESGHSSRRNDGRNLIDTWINDKKRRNLKHKFVWNSTEFNKVDVTETDYLLGLFEASHMQYESDRDKTKEPSLEEMTEKAIRILQKENKGYFLLVEGGRIDHGHHEGRAHRALHDTLAFDKAVTKATEITSELDTLIVVTADHSHVFSMGGYPTRGNPILGLTDKEGKVALDTHSKVYTTLVYGNGLGYHNPRRNVTNADYEKSTFQQAAAVPLSYETHGGEDVGIFARGPWAHLFHGVHQQNYIPHVMAFASCVGEYKEDKDCAASYEHPVPVVHNAASPTLCSRIIVLLTVLISMTNL